LDAWGIYGLLESEKIMVKKEIRRYSLSISSPTQEKNDRLCDAMISLANSMAEANLYTLPRKDAARKSFSP
jgi:hypothetical protein